MSLGEFAQIMMSIKPVLNNPDAFDKWMENEEVEFKEPPIQEDTKKVSSSESSSYYVRLITFYPVLYYFPSPEKAVTFIFLSKIVFWLYV